MIQEIKLTDKEKFDIFMKLKKRELAKMLIESNKQLETFINNKPVEELSYIYPEKEGANPCYTCPSYKHGEIQVCHCTLPYTNRITY